MYCPNCGKDAGESKFCPDCGAEVKVVESLSESQPCSSNKNKKKVKPGCIVLLIVAVILIAVIIGIPKFANLKKQAQGEIEYVDLSNTEIGLLNLSDDIEIISFSYNLKNIADKTIESLTFNFSIYNDDGIEKGSKGYTRDIILKPGESTDPERFDYWNSYYKNGFGKGPEFEDVKIDGVYTVDYKSIKVKSIEIKFSDETIVTQNIDYPIDRTYLKGTNDRVYYYVKRDDSKRISEQCSKKMDENWALDIPKEEQLDYPYYYPVK